MKSIPIPRILLDRLKKEFDDSHMLSSQFGKIKSGDVKDGKSSN